MQFILRNNLTYYSNSTNKIKCLNVLLILLNTQPINTQQPSTSPCPHINRFKIPVSLTLAGIRLHNKAMHACTQLKNILNVYLRNNHAVYLFLFSVKIVVFVLTACSFCRKRGEAVWCQLYQEHQGNKWDHFNSSFPP